MGAWGAGITSNDTAQDLRAEFNAVFGAMGVDEAVGALDAHVRSWTTDEDDVTWADYVYALADFMWKKGILTDEVRDRAVGMIDAGYATDEWRDAGKSALRAREKALAALRTELLSPLPPKKKIKADVNSDELFTDGDVVALKLQTAGKPYTAGKENDSITEADFRACDGKYVLLQKVATRISWQSAIVPDSPSGSDKWAVFRLFRGVYDTIPEHPDVSALKEAAFVVSHSIDRLTRTPLFSCESRMSCFKKRDAVVVGHDEAGLDALRPADGNWYTPVQSLFFGVNKPWSNIDSDLFAAMDRAPTVVPFAGGTDELRGIIGSAIRYGRFRYGLSEEENERIFNEETDAAMKTVGDVLTDGGQVFLLRIGVTVGEAAVLQGCIRSIRFKDRYVSFVPEFLRLLSERIGPGLCVNVPTDNSALLDACRQAGFIKGKHIVKPGLTAWQMVKK